jgi:hypothetical protein
MSANLKDFGDIFIGAKTQIVGEKAPVASETFRFAIGPGVKVPTGNPDYSKEYAKVVADIGRIMGSTSPQENITVGQIDKHTLGVGARTYFDYVFNKNFSISLFNEFIYYPIKVPVKEYALTETGKYLGTYQAIFDGTTGNPLLDGYANNATASAVAAKAVVGYDLDSKVNYRFDTTFEIETHLDQTVMTAAGKPILLHLGMPVSLEINPDVKIDGAKISDSGSRAIQVKPNASIFFAGWPLPMQFQLQYNGTVWGENTNSTNTFVAQIRVYFKF